MECIQCAVIVKCTAAGVTMHIDLCFSTWGGFSAGCTTPVNCWEHGAALQTEYDLRIVVTMSLIEAVRFC